MRALKLFLPRIAVNYFYHLPRSILANIIYGFPSRSLKVIGVTGTDGKTTTVNMIYKILSDAGKKVAMISTINACIGGKSFDTGFHVTNPDPFALCGYIRRALDAGAEFLVLEVTSHGLDQFRVWGISFEIGVITNVTHEHLDYHKTFGKYLKTKARLIENVKWAVLNKNDPNIEYLSGRTKGEIKTFKFSKDLNIKLKIPGDYNVLNALAAATVAQILLVDNKKVKKSLESFEGLPGRMEEVPNTGGMKVVIDFAHTPHALEEALSVLRKTTKGKLISVFGAAAQRDITKRPMMGKISARLADVTILTDEDPRYESSEEILDQIAVGAYQEGGEAGKTILKQPDRFKAIKIALEMAKKGDTVGIFGKGHEKSMNYLGKEYPWSDKEAVEKVLKV